MKDALTLALGSAPVVLDSPHSGTHYPAEFDFACDLAALRRAEDTHVDALYGFAPEMGVSLLCAHFPRSYLDANRALDEVDNELLATPWPLPIARSDKVALGKGLVWRLTDDGEPIYRRKLGRHEVLHRIAHCWRPYHSALATAIGVAVLTHGYCIHVNCHSMPSVAGSHATRYPGMSHPDFVIGDRDGTTAWPGLAEWMAAFLRGRGFSVAINHPYKGVELVRRHGNPQDGRHSVQLEVNRRLYMDESTLVPHEGFAVLRRVLQDLVDGLWQLRVPEPRVSSFANSRLEEGTEQWDFPSSVDDVHETPADSASPAARLRGDGQAPEHVARGRGAVPHAERGQQADPRA